MNRTACRKLLIPFFFLLFFIDPAMASSLPVIRHHIHIYLDVHHHSLKAADTLDLGSSWSDKGQKVSFRLRRTLRVSRILTEGGKNLGFESRSGQENVQVVSLKTPLPHEAQSLTVEYEGTVDDPVEKSRSLSFVAGDSTEGIIGPGGVYLSAESLWYPVLRDTLSKFEVHASIDGEYTVVTQGELLSRSKVHRKSLSHWKSKVPAEGLALVAGRYYRFSHREGSLSISVYFLSNRERLARQYLRKCREYIGTYSKLLGPYPYGRFDVVENFFSSGYGFPCFTLLGSGVFQRGEEALRPGYLDHEIVHSWWGNYVYNNVTSGNWVEALTTYCANYYQKELNQGPVNAAEHRKQVSLSYSQRVRPGREYPVREFRAKAEAIDGEIGYGKGSMIFHQLRRTVGDGIFWESLRELVRSFGARYAGWSDIQDIFEEKSGRDLKGFFAQWLGRKGGPRLRLAGINLNPAQQGYQLTGRVIQEGKPYEGQVPVHVIFEGDHRRIFQLDLRGPDTPFTYDLDQLPVYVKLDPEFHLFKILVPEDFPPTLNAALADPDKVFVVPAGQGKEAKIYQELAHRSMEQRGGRLRRPKEGLDALLKDHSLIIFGAQDPGKMIAKYLPPGIRLGADTFEINGQKFTGPEFSLLLSLKNPYNRAKTLTLYYGLGFKALERAPYLFYYGNHGYVVFRNGRPVKRGDRDLKKSRLVFNVPESLARGIKEDDLMVHARKLAAPEMEGRLAGSPGAERASLYIASQLRQRGLIPEKQPFWVQFQGSMVRKRNLGIRVTEKKTHNIYTLLKGTDPRLGREAILLGAHYDHLGRDRDGNIFQGADDNASGVSALLEILGRLVENKGFLKRSIIAVFFSGEEWNLQGSSFFADNLPFPGLKKIAMLNLDSIGRGAPGQYFLIGSSYYPSLWNLAEKFSRPLGLHEGKNIDQYAYIKGSDHYPFHLRGIPAVDLYSSNYREMNSLKDTISALDREKLAGMARLGYLVAFQLATDPVGLQKVRFKEEMHLANLRQLTFGGENAEAYFSPDGKKLIFQSTRNGRKCDQIYTMNIDGSQVRMVSTGRGVTTCSYFLPAGSGILYASTHLDSPACPPKPDYSHGYVWPLYRGYDIFRADPDGSNRVRLTRTPGYDAEATLSPGGRKIIFTSVRDGDLDLYAMDAEGGHVERLTHETGYDGGAFYSHDSKKIVYRADHLRSIEAIKRYRGLLKQGLIRPGNLELYVMNADGSGKRQITRNGAANFCPFMHPDGKRIIFSSNMEDPKGRNFDLYMINLDGTGLEKITWNSSFDGFPMFSPDGKKLVFCSNRNHRKRGETNVFIADWVE